MCRRHAILAATIGGGDELIDEHRQEKRNHAIARSCGTGRTKKAMDGATTDSRKSGVSASRKAHWCDRAAGGAGKRRANELKFFALDTQSMTQSD